MMDVAEMPELLLVVVKLLRGPAVSCSSFEFCSYRTLAESNSYGLQSAPSLATWSGIVEAYSVSLLPDVWHGTSIPRTAISIDDGFIVYNSSKNGAAGHRSLVLISICSV